MAIQTIEMDLQFMNYIPGPPKAKEELWAQACSNDGITIKHWKDTWIKHVKINHKEFGPLKNRSVGKLFNKFAGQPIIVVGSGPSLQKNVKYLKECDVGNEQVPNVIKNAGGIPIMSCLHNFHYMIDNDIPVKYFVTLDAGDITHEEVYEGGSKDPNEYFAATKDKTLLAYIGASPKLLNAWQGEILFFNAPVPIPEYQEVVNQLEPFNVYVSSGGNVLGACAYIARLMGAVTTVFMGADFCFSYTKKFHSWNSKYDAELGEVMRATDVFGNCVYTWQSYWNFKVYFDWLVSGIDGNYINCTEGGCMGAYPEGNIMQLRQMELKQFLSIYKFNEPLRKQCENSETHSNVLLY